MSEADGSRHDDMRQILAGIVAPTRITDDSIPERSLSKKTKDLDDLRLSDHQLDHSLKRWLGYGAVILLGTQMVVTNAACVIYGVITVRNGDSISDAALVAWMTSTIVEIVALALVVTKYLFPESGNNWNHEPR